MESGGTKELDVITITKVKAVFEEDSMEKRGTLMRSLVKQRRWMSWMK